VVARVGSLGSCIFIVEADDIFDCLDVCVLEFAEVLIHEVVALDLVDGEF
jgi:hypothetical protein